MRAGRATRPPVRAWVFTLGLFAAVSASAVAAPVVYQLAPTHGFMHFEWMHGGMSTLRGRFDKVSGQVRRDRANRQGEGQIEVRLDSVNTGRPTLDAALQQALS